MADRQHVPRFLCRSMVKYIISRGTRVIVDVDQRGGEIEERDM